MLVGVVDKKFIRGRKKVRVSFEGDVSLGSAGKKGLEATGINPQGKNLSIPISEDVLLTNSPY